MIQFMLIHRSSRAEIHVMPAISILMSICNIWWLALLNTIQFDGNVMIWLLLIHWLCDLCVS